MRAGRLGRGRVACAWGRCVARAARSSSRGGSRKRTGWRRSRVDGAFEARSRVAHVAGRVDVRADDRVERRLLEDGLKNEERRAGENRGRVEELGRGLEVGGLDVLRRAGALRLEVHLLVEAHLRLHTQRARMSSASPAKIHGRDEDAEGLVARLSARVVRWWSVMSRAGAEHRRWRPKAARGGRGRQRASRAPPCFQLQDSKSR